MLNASHAVWRPHGYHFRLPNGSHVSSFVRVADAIRDPRDAEVLAFWLQPDLQPQRGLVLDNRSMTPLALAIQRAFDSQAVGCGPISMLEHVPDSQSDIDAAVREAAADGGGVLAVLSVSSRGDTRDRLLAALHRMGQPQWAMHVLLDRSLSSDLPVPGDESQPPTRTWLGFQRPGDDLSPPGECRQCRTQSARVVAIDPRFFDGMVLPDPTLTMLSPEEARAAAPLWEACDAAGAVALEHPASDESRARRARLDDKGPLMGVFVSMDRLFASDGFEEKLDQGLRSLFDTRWGNRRGDAPKVGLHGIDLVIASADDAERPGWERFVQKVLDHLPRDDGEQRPVVRYVPHQSPPDSWPAEAIEAIAGSKHLLVLAAGTVTGSTLQRLLVGCQDHMRAVASRAEPLSGLVLHARTASAREWQTLSNSYGNRLYAVFDTVLPSVSPLRAEAALLSGVVISAERLDATWRKPVQQYLRQRRALPTGYAEPVTAERAAPYVPLLWGMPFEDGPSARVRQHSLFGHRLGPAALLAAVGACVHRQRERTADQDGPVWRLFDMPALFRSYYDPLILASMLRWIESTEMWWGATEETAAEVVTSVLERSTPEDLAVLLPELLLAAAQGKIPTRAAEVAHDAALDTLREPSSGYTSDQLVPLAAAVVAWRAENENRRPDVTAQPHELPGSPDGPEGASEATA